MATYQILSWHGIPTGVRAKDDKGTKRANLPIRFQAAVDAVATNTGNVGTADYLAGWQWSEPLSREGTAVEVAAATAAEIEADYSAARVKELRHELEASLKAGQAQ